MFSKNEIKKLMGMGFIFLKKSISSGGFRLLPEFITDSIKQFKRFFLI
jgi:hypothetical protein